MHNEAAVASRRIERVIDPVADEIETLRRENARLASLLAQAESLADSDYLTPLVNRRCMVREIDRAAARVARHGGQAAVLYADMNDLKTVNDRYGHAAGDAALLHLSDILLSEMRACDLIGRIGGDEFAVLLAQADEAAMRAAAARILSATAARPLRYRGLTLAIGVSIGSTPIRAGDTAEAVLARADAAMYVVKAAQRSER